jgi:PAS domain S-box-containing protein
MNRYRGLKKQEKEISDESVFKFSLEDQLHKYETILDSIEQPIYLIDKDYRIIYGNMAFEKWLESLNFDTDFSIKTITKAIPFFPAKVLEDYDNVFTKGIKHISIESTRINNQEIKIEITKLPLIDSGEIKQVLTVIHDISSRKIVEEFLQINEERYRMLIHSMYDIILVFDSHNKYSQIYTFDETKLFAPRETILGSHVSTVLPPHVSQLFNDTIEIVRETNKTQVFDYPLTIGGKELWFSANLSLHEDGESVVAVIRDITERKKVKLALEKNERKYRSLVETAASVIITLTEDGTIISLNREAERVYGILSKDVVGKNYFELFLPIDQHDRMHNLFRRIMDGETIQGFENPIISASGNIRHFLWNATKSHDLNDNPCILGIGQDITERDKAQNELRESEMRYRTLIDSSPYGIAVHKSGTLVYANSAAIKFLGASSLEDVIGINVLDIIHPDSIELVLERIRKIHQGKIFAEPTEEKWIRFDGKVVDVEVSASSILYQGEPASQVMFHDISYRKEISKALKESEEKFRSLYESSLDGIATSDLEGTIIESNPVYKELTGYTAEELAGMSYRDITPQKWHQFELSVLREQVDVRGYSNLYEKEYIKKDGSVIPIELRAYLRKDNLGNPIGYWVVVRDITRRKAAEELIRKSEERYRSLFENLADGIVITNTAGIIIMCNDKLLSLFGYQMDEVIGQPFIRFLHPEIRDTMSDLFYSGIEKDEIAVDGFDTIGTRKDGSTFFIKVSNTILHEDGKIIGYQSVIRDVTKERKAEATIIEERDRAQRYFDIAGAVMVVLDNSGNVQLINQRGCEILGYKMKDVVGQNWFNRFIPSRFSEEMKRVYNQLISGNIEGVDRYENPVVTKNGNERLIEWRNSLVTDNEGKIIGSISSGVDITERTKAEENLRTVADTAMLYLDIMGHDLRNHLQAIIMGTEIMQHYELGVETRPVFELIVESVENSQKLIDQVQSTRNLLSTPLQQVSLPHAIEKAVHEVKLRYGQDVELHVELKVENANVMADEYINVLLWNLLDNAIKHNKSIERKVWLRLREINAGFEIQIKDNGTGIPADRKESLFNPERRFGGVGVHQAKRIIEKYNGLLAVDDRVPGDSSQGASFSIWLPRAKIHE